MCWIASGYSLGDAVKAIEAAEREIGMPLSVRTSFQGAALAFRASLSNTLWLFLAAIVTMYIVLGVLYESYIHPLTILSTLPSAGIGALLALLLARQDLGVMPITAITPRSLRAARSASSAPMPAEGSVERIVSGWM